MIVYEIDEGEFKGGFVCVVGDFVVKMDEILIGLIYRFLFFVLRSMFRFLSLRRLFSVCMVV